MYEKTHCADAIFSIETLHMDARMLRENAYRYGTFEHALVALKSGRKVLRTSWGGDYLMIANGLVMRYDAAAALIGNYLNHATGADLLATDWRGVT